MDKLWSDYISLTQELVQKRMLVKIDLCASEEVNDLLLDCEDLWIKMQTLIDEVIQRSGVIILRAWLTSMFDSDCV